MPCTCNAICDSDCSSNQLCTGHVPVCSNEWTSFPSISIGTVILADHLARLEAAINQERTNTLRRFNAAEPAICSLHTPGDLACTNNDFTSFIFSGSRGIGDEIEDDHFNNIKSANNEVVNDSGYGGLITTTFLAQSVDPINSVIEAADITDLQTKINQTRNACICDSHCNCDPSDCGCNGECPSDDYYYYYP